ncbi:MAG: hypothetical protein ACRDVP_07490, partial [Acidimicrobiales bacterium]
MNGARFVHDALELCGWSVEVAAEKPFALAGAAQALAATSARRQQAGLTPLQKTIEPRAPFHRELARRARTT